jgi:hypothetical protein
MQEFFIREQNNEGVRVPLFRPDGTKTEHWLLVVGQFSDRFLTARSKLMRKASKVAKIENQEERETAIQEQGLLLTASLISDWSFTKPCTEANVVEFLRNAPQIAASVDSVSAQQALFLKSSSKSSGDTSSSSESSAPLSPDQLAPSETN